MCIITMRQKLKLLLKLKQFVNEAMKTKDNNVDKIFSKIKFNYNKISKIMH